MTEYGNKKKTPKLTCGGKIIDKKIFPEVLQL